MKHYDFLGQELFNGDEVVTIRKNGRAVGGSFKRTFITIKDGILTFTKPEYGFYKRGINEVMVKVSKDVTNA